jgi:hypothetical protein
MSSESVDTQENLHVPMTMYDLPPGHRQSLQQAKLTEYKGKGIDKPIARYGRGSIPLDEINITTTTSELRSHLREALKLGFSEKDEISVNEVVDMVLSSNPEYSTRELKKLRDIVGVYLRNFALQGAIVNVGESQPMAIQSAEQKSIAEFCVNLVENLQEMNSDFINEGLEKADAIMGDPDAVRALVAKAKTKSQNANILSPEERNKQLLDAVPKWPETDTVLGIEQKLYERGVRLSHQWIRQRLGQIAADGKVVIFKEGGKIRAYQFNDTKGTT